MPSFLFQLTFLVEGGTLVDDDSESIEIDFPGSLGTVELGVRHAESLSEASWFVFTGRGYETEEDAYQAGERARELVHFLQVEREVDIDLGDDEATGRLGDFVKERIKESSEEAVEVYDSVHGLAVYPEDPRPIISSGNVEFTVQEHWDRTVQELLPDLHESELSLDERSSLACSLYGSAQSANSPRANFLFLVTAIESLLEPEERSEEAVSLVDEFIEKVKSSCLDQSERDSLIGSLRWLRQNSITRTREQLVEKHLGKAEYDGMEAPDFFRKCYDIRSDLLHEGEPEDESIDVFQLANSLDEMVSDLLTSVCGAKGTG